MKRLYQCKKCNDVISSSNKLVLCKCGSIGIDSTLRNIKIIGNIDLVKFIEEEKETYCYRIKREDGLFFKPSSYRSRDNFSKTGKFYTRKPRLSWVSGFHNCEIEKYVINIVN
jgi:hypothetical protein